LWGSHRWGKSVGYLNKPCRVSPGSTSFSFPQTKHIKAPQIMTDTKDDSHRFSASSHLENLPDERMPSVGDLKPVIEEDDVDNPQVRTSEWFKRGTRDAH
jgi:hypothetical protein